MARGIRRHGLYFVLHVWSRSLGICHVYHLLVVSLSLLRLGLTHVVSVIEISMISATCAINSKSIPDDLRGRAALAPLRSHLLMMVEWRLSSIHH